MQPTSPPGFVNCLSRAVVTGIVLLSIAQLAVGNGCKKSNPPPAKPPLRIAIDLWAGYYPLVIASENGFLRDAGIAVEIKVPQDTKLMTADFAARNYDGICFSRGDTILLAQVKPDIRMILNSDESAGADVILSRQPITGPASIRGQRIATTLGGFGELLLRRFLDRHGVGIDEVALVNADAADVPALLARGEVGIAHTWEPYATQARQSGARDCFSSRDPPGLILDGLFVHADLLRSRQEDFRALVREWFRALDWWQANPAEGNALVEKRLALAPGAAAPTGIALMTLADNRRQFQLDAIGRSLPASIELFTDFFLARGLLRQRYAPTIFQHLLGETAKALETEVTSVLLDAAYQPLVATAPN